MGNAAFRNETLLALFDLLEHVEVVLDVFQRGVVGELFDQLDSLGFGVAHGD